jgi:hypothetical protein
LNEKKSKTQDLTRWVSGRCGGIFSRFIMTSSSSSNSSTSSCWVSSNYADDVMNGGGKQGSVTVSQNRGGKSWGWAFASPMKAFSSKGSSKENHQNNRRDVIRNVIQLRCYSHDGAEQLANVGVLTGCAVKTM